MKNGDKKVKNLNTRALKSAEKDGCSCGLLSAPKFLTILIGLLAFASPVLAAEIATESAADAGAHLMGLAKWFLILPTILLIGLSLIVNKRQGWGWVIVGMMIVIVLMIAQLLWGIITSLGGDTANEENYFAPSKRWTSDSFDD